jgi:predicted RNA binding protein YcfA (HicA-like mRNA interferase family)
MAAHAESPATAIANSQPERLSMAIPRKSPHAQQIHEGWFEVSMRGSHRQFKHPTRLGRVTVSGKPNDDLAVGTRNSILEQAGSRK